MTLLAVAVAGRGLVDPAEPVVHADDEGFIRGRGAFETLRVYGGAPFRLRETRMSFAALPSHAPGSGVPGGCGVGPTCVAPPPSLDVEPPQAARRRKSARYFTTSPFLLLWHELRA